jgi:predicted Zn finger-like uncharacterized protein
MAITQCPECGTRYQIGDQQAEAIKGKTATCKKCRARFVVSFIPPSTLEQASEQASQASEEGAKSPKRKARRTKQEIRKELIDAVSAGFRSSHARLVQIDRNPQSSEEEVRRWVLDVLRNCLGYDDADIVTEDKAFDRRIDISVYCGQKKPLIVFEIKNIRRALSNKIIEQLKSYAFSTGAGYAVLTNGAVWRFFKVERSDGADRFIEIFDLGLLDEDGVSDQDAEELYLLSKRSMECGDTEKHSHLVACLQPSRIVASLVKDEIIAKLRRTLADEYKAETGVNVDISAEVIRQCVEGLLLPPSL